MFSKKVFGPQRQPCRFGRSLQVFFAQVRAVIRQLVFGLLVAGTSLLFLALLGALAAYTGGARILIGVVRVTFWGALAMAITAGIGALFGTAA